MSVVDRVLLAEHYRQVAEASVMAEAPAAQAGEIGRGHPQSTMPPGAFHYSTSTAQSIRDRGQRAIAHDSDAELAAANRWGAHEIRSQKHGSKLVAESDHEFERRIIRDYEGVTAPEVARIERSYVKRIRELRIKHFRTARFGHKIAGKGLGGA